jgi:hypothetical protein
MINRPEDSQSKETIEEKIPKTRGGMNLAMPLIPPTTGITKVSFGGK